MPVAPWRGWVGRWLGRASRDPWRFRTLVVMLPLHLLAFAALYYTLGVLVERACTTAALASVRQRLDHVAGSMPYFVPQGGPARSPHQFERTIAAHRDIGLRLFDPSARPIGHGEIHVDGAVAAFLQGRRRESVWVEDVGTREVVNGYLRMEASEACQPCHPSGQLLGVAALQIDYTSELGASRLRLRRNLLAIVLVWAVAFVATTTVVRRSVARSAARLHDDLDAAEQGQNDGATPPLVVLDPITAELHRSLRELLDRQRRRQAELASRLAHADQLAQLGTLAAGLAHEIKNPLAGIHGALEVLRDDFGDDPEKRQVCSEMLNELKRVNAILERLLDAARPAPLRVVDCDLNQLVSDALQLMAPSLQRRRISIATELHPAELHQRVDPAKLRQVLLNLIQNAVDALPDGGRIAVGVSRFPDGTGAILTVADDGPGIAADDLERIFQPFFTTKFSGTGLGLAIAQSIVEHHGGRIEVDSTLGVGTTFFVFLPAPDQEGAGPSRQPEAEPCLVS